MTTTAPRPADRPHRVAVVAAMPSELRPFTSTLGLRRHHLDGRALHAGPVGTTEVVAISTGIGTTAAAEATAWLLDAVTVDHVIMIGVAGGLAADLPVRSLLVPRTVRHEATGVDHHATPLGDEALDGVLGTSDVLITDADRLARLAEGGVRAVDMETAALAAEAHRRDLPWTAFRAISDSVNAEPVDEAILGLTRPDGSADPAAALRFVLRRPGQIPRLARLGADAQAASRAASDAAIRALRTAGTARDDLVDEP